MSTEPRISDIRWAYAQILGHILEPGPAGDIDISDVGVLDLRKRIFALKDRGGLGPIRRMEGVFCSYRPMEPKVLVLGNCQAPNLARYIALISDLSVLGIEVMEYKNDKAKFLSLIEDADVILTAKLSLDFDEICTENLKSKFSKTKHIITYSSVYFPGEHPDITYWGGRGVRTASPLGDYHSRIVLRNFLGRKSEEDCASAFSVQTFAELSYFSKAQEGIEETYSREKDCDLKIGDFLEAQYGKARLFFSVNHPGIEIFKHLAEQFCRSMGLKPNISDRNSLPDMLSTNVIWPVHTLLVQHMDLKIASSDCYFAAGSMIKHEEFISRSYQLYESYGLETILAAAMPEQLAALQLVNLPA